MKIFSKGGKKAVDENDCNQLTSNVKRINTNENEVHALDNLPGQILE